MQLIDNLQVCCLHQRPTKIPAGHILATAFMPRPSNHRAKTIIQRSPMLAESRTQPDVRKPDAPRHQSVHDGASPHAELTENQPMRSLRTRLIALWTLLAASALVIGFLLLQFYRQSANVQIAQAEGIVIQACRDIGDRYAFYVSGWRGRDGEIDEALKGDLQDVVRAALGRAAGVEGGIGNPQAGR